jgi:hypothetical protein
VDEEKPRVVNGGNAEPGAAASHLERRRRFFFALFFGDRLGGESLRARAARDSVS